MATGAFAAISVPDAAATSRWYQEALGFRVLVEGASPDGRIHFALLDHDGTELEIVQRVDAAPAPAGPDASFHHGIFKLGFVVTDLEALEARLRARGVAFNHGIVKPTGNPLRTFAVRDNAGNVVQIFGR